MKMANWKCIKMCGACCHLDPEERPGLEEYLTPSELSIYLSLVGEGAGASILIMIPVNVRFTQSVLVSVAQNRRSLKVCME